MLPAINPTTTRSWAELNDLASKSPDSLREFFKENDNRLKTFTFDLEDLHFDFSKNTISNEVLEQLISLAKECKLTDAIQSMFKGEAINQTENRAVLHTALRSLEPTQWSEAVNTELKKIEAFSEKLIAGDWKGYSGKKITDVVNIGIGGSDLGPKMVTYALKPFWKSITPHFVSNVDAQQLVEVVEGLNPETTLFIIASKTFTTQETMTNAESARKWFIESGASQSDIAKHFVAVSTNQDAVVQFGIDPSNMFLFWDWVGGRYSLWSSIGLVIACTVGYQNFKQLLAGAGTLDNHFKEAPFEKNIPVIAALVGIWYNNFMNHESVAILPYDHRLRFLPSYLQQADMESNGKSVDRTGKPVSYQTGPIIWGEPGTNGQHAFYQLIHQGTKTIPCDFIATANSNHPHEDHHQKLLANYLAQPEGLMAGKTEEEVTQAYKGDNLSAILPFKLFEGNKPTTSILLKELTPFNLGMLVAFYEQKIFVQGIIWNIFSFDQWGVELGKELAKPILEEIKSGDVGSHDPSTSSLLSKLYFMRK